MSRDRLPLLALTMGDPAGIGPEVLLKAARDPGIRSTARCVAVGDAGWLRKVAVQLGLATRVRPVREVQEATFEEGTLDVLDLRNVPDQGVPLGQATAEGGRAAVEAVRTSALLAMQGVVDALVTAPLNKKAMHLAGFLYAGHTELLADLTGVSDVCMLLVADTLRVFQVTTHVSLRQACDLVTTDRVYRVIGIAERTLRRLGIPRPRIAVAGLNPHAGEEGLFGNEDSEQIAPAIERARSEGVDVSGPWPGDTIFARARAGAFDGVLAMYHDQGHIPVKLLGMENGVNVAAGLPIIRTSVDHGTAFDIAGRGIADHRSMVAAALLAARLVQGARG